VAHGIPQFFHTAIDAAFAVINSRRSHIPFSQALAADLEGNRLYVDTRHGALKLQHPGEDLHWFVPMNRATRATAFERSVRCFGQH
jgi:hypothetical protein